MKKTTKQMALFPWPWNNLLEFRVASYIIVREQSMVALTDNLLQFRVASYIIVREQSMVALTDD
jgi:uncharacterized membrane protein